MSKSTSYLPLRPAAATKKRLIEAGVRLFTSKAGTGLTTRGLAREANVNHALISYHFGGVSELMDAVIDRCIQDLRALFIPQLEKFEEHVRETSPEHMLPVLQEQMRELFGILAGPQGVALLRAFGSPDSASLRNVYGRFSRQVLQPLHHSFSLTAARVQGIPKQSLEAAVLGQCMVAQCMAFFRGAGTALAYLGKETFTPDEMQQISLIVAQALSRTAGAV